MNSLLSKQEKLALYISPVQQMKTIVPGGTQNTRETGIILSFLFRSYKKYVSPQDGNHCSFYPSCSVYLVESVNKNGLIAGWFLFGDRFLRCNSLNKKNYAVHLPTHLLYDPVP